MNLKCCINDDNVKRENKKENGTTFFVKKAKKFIVFGLSTINHDNFTAYLAEKATQAQPTQTEKKK